MTDEWGMIYDWGHVAARWIHVVAAIFWIGSTAVFGWMESRFHVEQGPDGKQRIWMVHGGGFYLMEKLSKPTFMPKQLHWFKWEAAITWISGMALLILVYYFGGALLNYDSEISQKAAIAYSLTILVGSWLLYDVYWTSSLGKYPRSGAALFIGITLLLSYTLHQIFSPRAAYLHIGAIFGTIMAANVWLRILPGQKRMVQALQEGREPDMSFGVQGKNRSRHNTYMAFPLVFMMVSNHFPTVSYGHVYNWQMVGVYLLLGFTARHLLNLHDQKPMLNP